MAEIADIRPGDVLHAEGDWSGAVWVIDIEGNEVIAYHLDSALTRHGHTGCVSAKWISHATIVSPDSPEHDHVIALVTAAKLAGEA